MGGGSRNEVSDLVIALERDHIIVLGRQNSGAMLVCYQPLVPLSPQGPWLGLASRRQHLGVGPPLQKQNRRNAAQAIRHEVPAGMVLRADKLIEG
jgi:hypothetical protein